MKKTVFLVVLLVLMAGFSLPCLGQGASNGEDVWIGSKIGSGYAAYQKAQEVFEQNIRKLKRDHELLDNKAYFATVQINDLVFDLLPLTQIGSSAPGPDDESFRPMWVWIMFASDGEITENEDGSILISGTKPDGTALATTIWYDPESDQLRMEARRDDELVLLVEYVKTADGYAAQYYHEVMMFTDDFRLLGETCVYREYLRGANGSRARFDGVEEEPPSILDCELEEQEFISGASHWYTVEDGKSTGHLDGQAF